MNYQSEKSSTGLDANVAALLSYLLGIIGGIIFFVIEKESGFVRFHAMQSILLSAVYIIVIIVVEIFTFILVAISTGIGLIVSLIFWLAILAFLGIWILMMIKAYQGEVFKLPVIGDMAENIVNK